jgi:hypothetical protein
MILSIKNLPPRLAKSNPYGDFLWRTKDSHQFIAVWDMNTKHVFYTLLMIWNHSAPEDAQIWFRHRYVFDSFYTPEYMLQAFNALYHEIKTREDLGYKMSEVVYKMETYREAPRTAHPERSQIHAQQSNAQTM